MDKEDKQLIEEHNGDMKEAFLFKNWNKRVNEINKIGSFADNIEIEINKENIIIDGFDIPYWNRMVLALCWWKTPRIVLKNLKIFYRNGNGELIDLKQLIKK